MLKLRDYQRECLKAVYENYRAGIRRQIVSLPTGSGKTVIFSELPRYLKKTLYISSAKQIARPTSTILIGGKVVIRAPIFPFETVCKWSQLTAQSRGMPSDLERNTSEGISRTVLVIGATVTSPRYSKTESRVRIRTGLFLSG